MTKEEQFKPEEEMITDNLRKKVKHVTFKSDKPERVYRKHVLHVNRKDFSLLEEPLIEVKEQEDADKLDEFRDYLWLLCKYCNACISCENKHFSLRDCSSSENEILIKCPVCGCTVSTDNTLETKKYIRWFKDNILRNDPDFDLTKGFPKLLRHKYMGKCYTCPGIPVHEKEMIQFFHFR